MAIKASELRIGNIIGIPFYKKYKERSVQAITYNGVHTEKGKYRFDSIIPLSITIEKMDAFGFNISPYSPWLADVSYLKYCRLFYHPKYKDDFEVFVSDRGCSITLVERCNSAYFRIPNHIKYVHDLQNFFWSFTGEELQIKEV